MHSNKYTRRGRRQRCCSKGNDREERYACYRLGKGWENGSKFNLCLGSKEGMEDQMKRTVKGRIGLRRKLKKSQRGRLRKKKEDMVADLSHGSPGLKQRN